MSSKSRSSGIWKLRLSDVSTPPGAIALTRSGSLGVLHGQRPGELHDGALGHAVGDGVRLAHEPGVRRDVDDVALGLEQVGDGGLGEEEAAVDVHAHHLAVGALLDVGEVLGACDAGDVAEHVEATELLDRRGDGGDALVAAADVAGAGRRRCAPASATSLAVSASASALRSCASTCAPSAGEAQRDRPPDARAGARDQRDLAVEACHRALPLIGPVRRSDSP